MGRLLRLIADWAVDDGFLDFQNRVVAEFYDALDRGFSKGENEVSLVSRLVSAADGERYGPIRLHAAMLHGTRSYVEFNYRDKPVTKELGDMILVTLVTAGRKRILQRLSIVQNKKSSGKSWPIDQEQLFLLKKLSTVHG